MRGGVGTIDLTNEVPLGHGGNSIVYLHPTDDSKVIIFTADAIKTEIYGGLGYGHEWDYFESPVEPKKTIYVILADRLYPLSEENKTKVRRAVRKIQKLEIPLYDNWGRKVLHDWMQDVIDVFWNYDLDRYKTRTLAAERAIVDTLRVVQSTWTTDSCSSRAEVNLRNFMQTKQGKIVAHDIVAHIDVCRAPGQKKPSRRY